MLLMVFTLFVAAMAAPDGYKAKGNVKIQVIPPSLNS